MRACQDELFAQSVANSSPVTCRYNLELHCSPQGLAINITIIYKINHNWHKIISAIEGTTNDRHLRRLDKRTVDTGAAAAVAAAASRGNNSRSKHVFYIF